MLSEGADCGTFDVCIQAARLGSGHVMASHCADSGSLAVSGRPPTVTLMVPPLSRRKGEMLTLD